MNKVNIAGIEFCTENNDFWSTIASWEPYSFAALKQFSDKNKTFIDVGAWIGPLSLFASSSYKNVIAFEPDTKAFTELVNNIKLNNLTNITAYNVACSAETGKKLLYITTPCDSISSLVPREYPEITSTEMVNTIALDPFLRNIDNVGLVKIDIEGGEVILLPALADYLNEFKPPIYLSFHPFWFTDKSNKINELADIMCGVYAVQDINFNQITKQQLVNELNTNAVYTYLFTAKD